MNFIILGILFLCGASSETIATTAIVLGAFDMFVEFLSSIFDKLEEAYKNKQKK